MEVNIHIRCRKLTAILIFPPFLTMGKKRQSWTNKWKVTSIIQMSKMGGGGNKQMDDGFCKFIPLGSIWNKLQQRNRINNRWSTWKWTVQKPEEGRSGGILFPPSAGVSLGTPTAAPLLRRCPYSATPASNAGLICTCQITCVTISINGQMGRPLGQYPSIPFKLQSAIKLGLLMFPIFFSQKFFFTSSFFFFGMYMLKIFLKN